MKFTKISLFKYILPMQTDMNDLKYFVLPSDSSGIASFGDLWHTKPGKGDKKKKKKQRK